MRINCVKGSKCQCASMNIESGMETNSCDLSSIRQKIKELLQESNIKKSEIQCEINVQVATIENLKLDGIDESDVCVGDKGCRGCFDSVINVDNCNEAASRISNADLYKEIDP